MVLVHSSPYIEEKHRLVIVWSSSSQLETSRQLLIASNHPAGTFAYQTLFMSFVCFQKLFRFAQFVGELSGTEKDVCSCQEYPHWQMPNLFSVPGGFTFQTISFQWC